ncbi:intein-containing Rv2578c family radical SAM protein [Microbacterium sp. cx-59]|uniref:intein-containing Rv2578c family radical SAM protein n=1 Tax=Microbacterium sp. cx-59 TaxID=2891207 RepID=UPI001E4C5736|nr:intein-containing Rv2578c family radical SAM protein [Microbacterium sp. cx-59]MCC4908501.1 intein-containing Rv2578c family radical SAM protein [Microbacterium sp. cx-59]
MRWQGQQVDASDAAALPGMEQLSGLVRSVTTPEFAGMTFHEVAARSALNHVPGSSAMPFDWTVNPYRGCSHACVYCLAPDTLILMADGRQRSLRDIRIGDDVMGTEQQGAYRRYVPTTVMAKWDTRKRAYRVTLADGTEIVASGDHRFLTERGWKHVVGATSGAARRPHLTPRSRLMGFGLGGIPPAASLEDDYRRGYLCGMVRGDGMLFHATYVDERRSRTIHRFRLALADGEALARSRAYLSAEGVTTLVRPFATATATRKAMTALHSARGADVARVEALAQAPVSRTRSWQTGFLAGIFDAEGSCSRGIVRVANKDPELLALTREALQALDLPYADDPIRPNGVSTIRLVGGLPVRDRFFRLTLPAITRKISLQGMAVKTFADLHIVSIEDLGTEHDLIDITTGTGDFVANGVVSHNCFARGTHTYLDLDAGRDFDSQVVVKVNVAEVLERELHRGSWGREHVALGTNTDPYQRAEGRYRLMPGIIEALAGSDTPFSILTKGTLLRRDLPLLQKAHARVPISIAMSIAVYDDELQKQIEPGTPSAQARLDTVRAATDAGFRVTVFLMPVLPHLTDSIAALDDALRRIRDAGAVRVVYGALHLRAGVKPWFMQWLESTHPHLVSSYLGLYPGVSAAAPKAYRQWLARRVRPLLRAHGLDGRDEEEPVRARPAGGGPPGALPVRVTSRGLASAAASAAAAASASAAPPRLF